MTAGPAGNDAAFARALDRFVAPPPSAGLAARIADAALEDAGTASAPSPVGERRARDRRGPWTRRALAGATAVVLGTTAVAAALLDRGGFPVAAIAGLIAPARIVAAAPPPTPRHDAAPPPRRSAPPVHAMPVPVAVAVAVAVARDPQRAALLRDRLVSLPPEVRRAVVRRVVIRRALLARRAARDQRIAAGENSTAEGAAGQEFDRLADRPLLRAALLRRWRAARERRSMSAASATRAEPGMAALPEDAARADPPMADAPRSR